MGSRKFTTGYRGQYFAAFYASIILTLTLFIAFVITRDVNLLSSTITAFSITLAIWVFVASQEIQRSDARHTAIHASPDRQVSTVDAPRDRVATVRAVAFGIVISAIVTHIVMRKFKRSGEE